MGKISCSVDSCGKESKVRGFCNAHYLRLLRHGDPEAYRKVGTHRQSNTPEYRAWINMKSRCYNPDTPGFDRYGGRGIAVCDRWFSSFGDFLSDIGPRPSPKHSVDRWPNPDGDYEPGNVRWAVQAEQMRNVCCNRMVEVDGRKVTLAEAVETSGLLYNTVLYRLKRGWLLSEALAAIPHKGARPSCRV